MSSHTLPSLRRGSPTTLQINLGKICNQVCRHCHVDAGPHRTEQAPDVVVQRVADWLDKNATLAVLDITGGAPELHPQFRWLVEEARKRDREVIDRCNLTVFFEPTMEDLPSFLAQNQVHVIASLPCYLEENVDQQRGKGVYAKSIEALRILNRLGYASSGSPLKLDLVYNPIGAYLPPPQAQLESDYRRELGTRFGLSFNHLLTITNMPIERFAGQLRVEGKLDDYMELLQSRFNPDTLESLMCRKLISVGWDGTLYDCDFNQMLGIPLADARGQPWTIFRTESPAELLEFPISTGPHCFGCTAGAGSSCGGALV